MADIIVMNKQEQEISTGATQENTATQPLPVEPVTPVPSYVEGLTEDETDQEAVTTEEPKFLSLEEILGMDTADLTAEKQASSSGKLRGYSLHSYFLRRLQTG